MILDTSPSDKGRKADWERRQKERGDDAQWAQREEEENQEWGRVERERGVSAATAAIRYSDTADASGRTDGRGVPFPSCELRQAGPTDEQTDNYRGKACWGGKESAGRRETQSLESYVQ